MIPDTQLQDGFVAMREDEREILRRAQIGDVVSYDRWIDRPPAYENVIGELFSKMESYTFKFQVRVIAVDGVPCYEKRGTMDVLEISVRPGSLRRINLPRVRAWAKAEVVS